MLQKICDCCKKQMILSEYYDEGTFNLIINTESGKELSFNGDLCEECEKDIIEGIKSVLHSYCINESEQEKMEEPEEPEELEEEENFEMKLIENKEKTEEKEEEGE